VDSATAALHCHYNVIVNNMLDKLGNANMKQHSIHHTHTSITLCIPRWKKQQEGIWLFCLQGHCKGSQQNG